MDDFALDVENLAVRHRAKAALRSLMTAGPAATPFLRRGLHHENPFVVMGCCDVLDHFLDERAVPDLLAVLEHRAPGCRARAMHALACGRCKEGACRPGEDDSIPMALAMLRRDPSARVRVEAVHVLFPAVHRRPDVAEALAYVRDNDSDANVRKQAGLRAPGGVKYLRSSPFVADRRKVRNSGARGHLARA